MEVLKGALIAVAWGCLFSLVLALLVSAMALYYSPESGWGASIGFVLRRTLGLLLIINLFVAPASFVVGLEYCSLRAAVRHGVEQGRASTPDS